LISLNRFFYQITSLPTNDATRNSASVLDVVTVFYFDAFHAIGPPNSINT
jgi:hypothetical protein